ncbi:hypothetical protein KFL_001940170 [Klebsormidium nitens]|uniref:Uncharacterized protein n=1 Tax=Klebsormidium nitens TaxID=105231 RepID=A0A1Y1I0U3_KLENI|nr:hypothetical protein KFL_001940170 [Klebsormidium nitens]|eukprot:GAQ84560.1 hypothetical protein KFL_001940170 [Klebsormidium nitens]
MNVLAASKVLFEVQRRGMAQAVRCEGDASFDDLPFEIVDCIVRRLAVDKPAAFNEIARVNKILQESARRYSQTLVLRRPPSRSAGKAIQRPTQEKHLQEKHLQKADAKASENEDACRALAKQLQFWPSLSNLVVSLEASENLWPAISGIQWKSVTVALQWSSPGEFFSCLSKSRNSLKRLDVHPGDYYPPNLISGILFLAHFFPELEILTLRGGKDGCNHLSKFSFAIKEAARRSISSLSHLEITSHVFPDWSTAVSRSLPADLPALISLRCQCKVSREPCRANSASLRTSLKRLQYLTLTVRDEELPNSTLQDVAENCQWLRHLAINAVPSLLNRLTPPSAEILDFSTVVDTCPDLVRLVVSRVLVTSRPRFLALVKKLGLTPASRDNSGLWRSEKELYTKVLVLRDKDCDFTREVLDEAASFSTPSVRVSVFRLVVPIGSEDWERRKDSFFQHQSLLGEDSAVKSWKVTESKPWALEKLASVSESFDQSARRCSRTLVLRWLPPYWRAKKGPKKPIRKVPAQTSDLQTSTLKPFQKAPQKQDACTALMKEVESRPSLCDLVVGWNAWGSDISPALSSIEWKSVTVKTEEMILGCFIDSLSTSTYSLKRMDVDPGDYYPPNYTRGIQIIADKFPNLEALTIRGGQEGRGDFAEFFENLEEDDSARKEDV